jgi:DNA polymerase delta subunit 4
MPATRSKSATRGARNQSTLSFHGKVTKSHITPIGKESLKPSQTPPSSQPPKPSVIAIQEAVVEPPPVEPQDAQPVEAAAELYMGEGVRAAPERQAAALVQEQAKSEAEVEAEKITMGQIKAYWRERENERIAARVHQEDLSVEEKILRLFDMSSHFGVSGVFGCPCSSPSSPNSLFALTCWRLCCISILASWSSISDPGSRTPCRCVTND